MQLDFHYYATYCAAYLAGFSHEESQTVAYSAQFVDCCSRTLLGKIDAPKAAATTQLQLELMDARTDITGLQDITRIWSSFHFLPKDLYAQVKKGPRKYKNKYRLICGPNGELVKDTVELARGGSLQAVGVAMHVLADTWAHQNFAGTPSLVINNTDYYFYERTWDGQKYIDEEIKFKNDPTGVDDLENKVYINSLFQGNENSIMNLGHGRAGHLPDYSFMRYKYMPAWGDYEEVIKDNPTDYYRAFLQMIYAMKTLRSKGEQFQTRRYDIQNIATLENTIKRILLTRQLDSSSDWKALGERLSGRSIETFSEEKYQQEYIDASEEEKDNTFIGKFILAAMAQKSMVAGKIFESGNRLAGISVDYSKKGFKGNREYRKLVEATEVRKAALAASGAAQATESTSGATQIAEAASDNTLSGTAGSEGKEMQP